MSFNSFGCVENHCWKKMSCSDLLSQKFHLYFLLLLLEDKKQFKFGGVITLFYIELFIHSYLDNCLKSINFSIKCIRKEMEINMYSFQVHDAQLYIKCMINVFVKWNLQHRWICTKSRIQCISSRWFCTKSCNTSK